MTDLKLTERQKNLLSLLVVEDGNGIFFSGFLERILPEDELNSLRDSRLIRVADTIPACPVWYTIGLTKYGRNYMGAA